MQEDDHEQEHPVRNLLLSVCDLKQRGETPAARCGAQAVTIATRVYLHGGCDAKKAFGDLHLLEIEQMKWSPLHGEGPAPSPRWGHTMQVHEQDLVLFGGQAVSDQVSLLEESADTAATSPPFFNGVCWPHRGAPSCELHKMNTQSLLWTAPACTGDVPPARFCHSACVCNDLFVVFGGTASADFLEPLADLRWLDLSRDQWISPTTAGQAPSPRFGHNMMRGPEDQLYIFGGSGGPEGSNANPGVLHAFAMSTMTWSSVLVSGTPPMERSFHTLDFIGKWGFCFAGLTPGSVSDLYILDVPNMRWARPLYEGQVNVRAHASAILHDKLIVFGGVRDKAKEGKTGEMEPHISKKLFFLNVLEVRSGVAEGDLKFKLVTVGDSGVGKSCLLTRFVQDFYSDFHVSTIGVDFKTVVTMVKGRLVKLQLWDTAGQERFSVVTGNYYRNSDGFILVYDATNRSSFDHIEQWLAQVKQHHACDETTIKILIGNKSDMKGELDVTEAEGRAKAATIGASYISTSAKTAANVDMAFLTAAQNLVEMRLKQKGSSATSVGSITALGSQRVTEEDKGSCGGTCGR